MPVSSIVDFLGKNSSEYKFLFVDDGSKDDTAKIIHEIHVKFPERTRILNLSKNVGKAEAIRTGALTLLKNEMKFDYLGFMDADLSTPVEEIENVYRSVEALSRPALIIGSRIKLFGSTNIIRSDRRHYIGRIIATLISKSLNLPIYDTQCGFKFIRYDKIHDLFHEPFISRWLFDVELIFRLVRITGRDGINGELFELPVKNWVEKGQSKIPFSYAFRLPFELFKIKRKYR